MQNFFDLVARGGTAPTASSSTNKQQALKKYQKQQVQLLKCDKSLYSTYYFMY